MKYVRLFFIVISIVVLTLISYLLFIINVNNNNFNIKTSEYIEELESNLYNNKDILDTYYYFGRNAYMMVKYKESGIIYLDVVKNYEVIDKINYNEIKELNDIDNTYDVVIGYDNTFIYEVKRNEKTKFIYEYYDVRTLDIINTKTLKKR